MADVVLIIALRQFWLRRIFFGKQALPKNRGHILTAKIGINRSDRSYRAVLPVEALWPVWQRPTGLTGLGGILVN